MSDVRVNVMSPEGELVSLPASQINEATSPENGFRVATPEEVQHHFKEQKFGTLPQQALTAVEGAGEGVAGPLFTAAERATGLTTPENMQARREINPVSHAVGQAAGLTGSMLAGEGVAPLLGKVGEAAAGLAGGEGIAAAGVRAAAEMAMLQSGDEVSKALMNDPSQSIQTAVANVGLSALLGGVGGSALASVNPLWEASGGPKLGQFAEDFKGRMQGHLSGMELPAEDLTPGMKAADFLMKKGVEKMAGKSIAGAVGASLGSSVGHPWLGALIGERALGPMFDSVLPALAKPIMNSINDGGALKSAIDYGLAVVKGEKIMDMAAKNVFKPGIEALADNMIPKLKDREKLRARLEEIEENPEQIMNQTDKFTQYFPDHAGAKGATVGAAYEYLKGIEPKAKKNLIMDQERKPDSHVESDYARALDLAQQPALAFQRIKDGTINSQDMKLLQSVYPSFYKSAVVKLHNELVNHLSKEGTVPYKTRVGLAKFFGEPLDSTMLPTSMMSIQQSMATAPAKPPIQAPKKGGGGGKAKALEKQASLLQSPQQASESRHRAQF